jgi:uncharacterized protein YbjT (DUF2867 family)
VAADVRDGEALRKALSGVDTAFYLIHSLLPGDAGQIEDSVGEAASFRRAAAACDVRRIIYLGSLVDVRAMPGSPPGRRVRVIEELRSGPVPVTELRADIIIGSGSASYEIIRNLVRRLPLMALPAWTSYRRMPLWIGDVVAYLVGVLEEDATATGSYELCGDELTYEQMLRLTAAALGKNTRFFSFPFKNTSFYAYAASLMTPVPDQIAQAAIGALRHEADCRDRSIGGHVDIAPLSYERMLHMANTEAASGEVETRWSDAWPHEYEQSVKLSAVRDTVDRQASYSLTTSRDAAALFATMCDIGGERGWLHDNWMWRLRGNFDRVVKGAGSIRGRKKSGRLAVNDVVDFWRVEAIEPDRRLLLRAEMKLPGHGWLELSISERPAGRELAATAYFISRGLTGRLYWYAFYPFHVYIFNRLLRGIEARSGTGG